MGWALMIPDTGFLPLERKILVVEDHPDSRDLLALYLRMQGYTVYTAEDGREGLRLVQLDCPNMIITDLSMPHLDGVELIRRVRQLPECRVMPIVVMTAYGQDEEAAAIKAGADYTVTKPLDYESLIHRITELLHD
jgi:two-component system phosphate regulon response regulator PhoB